MYQCIAHEFELTTNCERGLNNSHEIQVYIWCEIRDSPLCSQGRAVQSPGVRAGLGGGPGRPSLRGVMGFEKWRRLDSENFPTCRRSPRQKAHFQKQGPPERSICRWAVVCGRKPVLDWLTFEAWGYHWFANFQKHRPPRREAVAVCGWLSERV